MKPTEFQQWFRDLNVRFPDTASWIAKNDRNDSEQIDILKQWSDALADVELTDALEVNARIHRGQIMLEDNRPGIPAYDRENVPAIVRRHALNLRVQRMIVPNRVETWRDGFKCVACQDSGFRPVWSNRAIAFMRDHGNLDGFGNLRHVLCRCNCDRGHPRGVEEKYAKQGQRIETVPQFHENSFCQVFSWDTRSEKALNGLAVWVAEYEQRRIETAYHGDFTEYNRAGGHIA